MTNMKVMICTVLGAVGGFVTNLFGGWTEDMVTLVIFMVTDFVMGLLIALVFKKSNKTQSGAADSKACFKGLCKKCVILLFVLIAHRLDLALNCDYIKTATIIGFIVNELISIIENAGLMGVEIPEGISKALHVLNEKNDKNE